MLNGKLLMLLRFPPFMAVKPAKRLKTAIISLSLIWRLKSY
jgi:hypothetical protein